MRGSILRPIFDGIAAKIRIGRQIEGIPRRAVGQLPMFNRDAILKAPCAHPHPFPNMVAAHRTRTERSEEHTSELQSLMRISYAVFCLKKKKKKKNKQQKHNTRTNIP